MRIASQKSRMKGIILCRAAQDDQGQAWSCRYMFGIR